MFDTAWNNQFPSGGQAYAAYVDGGVGDQPNYAWIVSAFPSAHHLSITLFGNDADCADVENGAMSPDQIPGWYARQVTRGVKRPVIYASASTMQGAIVPVIDALPGPWPGPRLWTAHYGLGEHICGPSTCGELSINADGTQWTSNALGRTLDQSLLTASFFAAAPAPVQTWEDKLMATIPVIAKGSKNVQAVKNWQGLLIAREYNLGTTGPRKDGVDGVFGAATDTATRAFQKAAKVTVDGQVGPQTWTAALAA
jgi:hypothetical protein